MRSMDWKQLVGKIIHGNTCLWLMKKESSIFNAQRSTSFRILYCVLVRYTRTPYRTMHGNKDWSGSKVHRNTETWTDSTVRQWTSSEIFSQDSIRCSSMKKTKVYCWDKVRHQRISQEEWDSCRCSTTILVDQETMKKNACQMPISFLYMQEDLEHWSFIGRWDLWSENNLLGKLLMEVFVFDWGWTSHQSSVHKSLRILRFCIVSWKDEREPWIKYCMGWQIDVVQKFTRVQSFGQNWWWANGIRAEHLPRIHHIAVLPQSPRVTVKIERNTRTI